MYNNETVRQWKLKQANHDVKTSTGCTHIKQRIERKTQ